jgi:hypothetical protein
MSFMMVTVAVVVGREVTIDVVAVVDIVVFAFFDKIVVDSKVAAGPRGNRQSWRHLDEVGPLASRAPDNKPGQQDEREYLE